MLFPASADAQSGTQLESVNIDLWSEYDQPSMLVIHEFVVAESTTLPTQVTLRFPKDANLIAVAFDKGGTLFNTEFEGPTEQGDWQILVLTVKSRDPHRIEYYQPLIREGNKRTFSFEWFGNYSVKKFSLSALIPADSADIITSPSLSNASTTPNGLYLTDSASLKLKMGESYDFQIKYTRPSESIDITMPTTVVKSSDPVGSSTAGRVSVDKLPWVILGFGLALIVVMLFLFSYWRSMRSTARPVIQSDSSGPHSHRLGEENGDMQVYCHKCGTRASTGDRFCRVCGSKLRIE
jgi:hypothetical protein